MSSPISSRWPAALLDDHCHARRGGSVLSNARTTLGESAHVRHGRRACGRAFQSPGTGGALSLSRHDDCDRRVPAGQPVVATGNALFVLREWVAAGGPVQWLRSGSLGGALGGSCVRLASRTIRSRPRASNLVYVGRRDRRTIGWNVVSIAGEPWRHQFGHLRHIDQAFIATPGARPERTSAERPSVLAITTRTAELLQPMQAACPHATALASAYLPVGK